MPPRSRLARRPLDQAQLVSHFRAAEALIGRALDLRDELVVDLRTANPTTRSNDEWKLSVATGPLLDHDHIEFACQFSISLLVAVVENYHYGEDDFEDVWERAAEAHLFDRDWRTITCAFASWLLRTGWIFVDGELTAAEAIDGEYYTADDGRLGFNQAVRLRGTPPIEPPHWQRANELRKAWQDRQPPELSEQEQREEWERWMARFPDEEPFF